MLFYKKYFHENSVKKTFKANSLELLRKVQVTKKSLIVTDRGVPVIEIFPFQEKKTLAELFATHRGKGFELGDVEGPVPKESDFKF